MSPLDALKRLASIVLSLGTTTYFWRAPGGRGFDIFRAFEPFCAFWQRVRNFARFLEALAAKHNVEPLVSAAEDARGLCSSYPEVDGISVHFLGRGQRDTLVADVLWGERAKIEPSSAALTSGSTLCLDFLGG